MHLIRAALMLAEHSYSTGEIHKAYQDENYKVYATTDRKSRSLMQKLDEHNIGVARNAFFVAKSIPRLREDLPIITRHKGFKQRSKDARFSWQDKAFDLASSLKSASYERGFFGLNLASTGCGKTF